MLEKKQKQDELNLTWTIDIYGNLRELKDYSELYSRLNIFMFMVGAKTEIIFLFFNLFIFNFSIDN